MPKLPSNYRNDKPAYDFTGPTADAANAYEATQDHPNSGWPVSADETKRALGTLAVRDAQRKAGASLWHSPGVAPRIKTTGIRVGDTITTWQGQGIVTRVGTMAGFYLPTGNPDDERRWDVAQVRTITPAGQSAPVLSAYGAEDTTFSDENGFDDDDADGMSEYPQCPVCGEPVDYCQGHGTIMPSDF